MRIGLSDFFLLYEQSDGVSEAGVGEHLGEVPEVPLHRDVLDRGVAEVELAESLGNGVV